MTIRMHLARGALFLFLMSLTTTAFVHAQCCGGASAATSQACCSQPAAQPTSQATTTKACSKSCTKPCCPAASQAATQAATQATQPAVPKIGDAVADFALPDETGKIHRLSDYKDKIVVLSWTNPDCPYIVAHYKEKTLNKLAADFGGDNVVLLQIDSSNFATAQRTKDAAKKYGVKVKTLHDPAGKVGRKYGAKTTPHNYVIDKKGKLAYMGALDNAPLGKLAAGSSKEINYVEAAVKDVLAGRQPATKTSKPYGCSVKYARN